MHGSINIFINAKDAESVNAAITYSKMLIPIYAMQKYVKCFLADGSDSSIEKYSNIVFLIKVSREVRKRNRFNISDIRV